MTWHTTTELMDHQRKACDKLLRSRVGALFMEQGTGKTRTVIEFAHRRMSRYDVLVWLCPDNVKTTIKYEWLKHTTLSEDQIAVWGSNATDKNLPSALVHIVGLEGVSMSKRVTLALNKIVTDQTFLVVDESTHIKNHRALRTQRVSLIGERSKYRLILTGTPTSQGAEDLFSQMAFLSHKILGYRSFYSFAANHLEFDKKFKKWKISAHNTSLIASKIAPYVYQVRKSECLDLPQKQYYTRYFRMNSVQRDAYTEAKEITFDAISNLENIEDTSFLIFRMFGWLQQIVAGFWNHPELGTQQLSNTRVRVLEDVVTQRKTIIWVSFQESVHHIVTTLGQNNCSLFYGGIPKKQRDLEIERWKSTVPYLIATPQTGGLGLTLNEAEEVVYYSNTFSYMLRMQTEDRCHRAGQTKSVRYTDILAEQSVDVRIQDALYRKSSYAQELKQKLALVKDMKKKEALKVLRGLINEI